MPRKPRELVDFGFYHLIARGNNRLFIFHVTGGFDAFKSLLHESKQKFSWKLHHYCLMANHIHLLIQMERGAQLPKLMQYLLFEYSRWYRKQTGYTGHLWQGRYKSPLIETESYLLECGRYIERNPVRAKLVPDLGDYPHSSYPYYAFGKDDPLIDEDPYYQDLGGEPDERQRRYREFVKLDGPYDKVIDQTLVEAHF